MKQNRFLSPVVWGSVAAQVLAILVALGVIDTGMSEALDAVVASILQLLVTIGVMNNPTSKTDF